MAFLTTAQEKELARQLAKLFPRKNPVSKKGNSIRVEGAGGVATFPVRATQITKERTIS